MMEILLFVLTSGLLFTADAAQTTDPGALDYNSPNFFPLQFSLSAGQTLIDTTPGLNGGGVGATPTTTAPSSITGSTNDAAYPSLTGAALSSAISEENAEFFSDLSAAYPSVAPSAISDFISENNAAYDAYATLSGAALSSYVSEENVEYASQVTAAYPTLTGSALSDYLSGGDVAAPTGSALSSYISAENAEFASEITAAYPSITGAALSSYLYGDNAAADSGFDDGAPYTSLTGTALSAYLTGGDDSVNPTLTGSAAAAASADIASEISVLNAYATASPTGGNLTDACGPTIPDPSVPDSCNTPVETTDTPAAYGVQCLNDTQSATPVNLTSCSYLIPELCANQWQKPGNWVWLTANGCSLGSYLPPQTPPGAAPWPSGDMCEQLIFASMVDGCDWDGVGWNVAAVNLRTLPDETGTGSQVNVGYGSYLVAERQLRGS